MTNQDAHASAAGDGPVTELWSLRPDVLVETDAEDGTLTLVSRWGETVIRRAGPTLRDLLARMQLGPTRLDNVLDVSRSTAAEVLAERTALIHALGMLQHLVVRSLATEEGARVLLSVEPVSRRADFRPRSLRPGLPLRLSRFTALRPDGGMLQAESPLSLHRVMLHRPEAAALVAALARPRAPSEFGDLASWPVCLLHTALSFLVAAGVAVQAEDAGDGSPAFAEDRDPVLRMWSPLDLMFHTRSTLGRFDGDFGATYPLGSRTVPEPVVKPRPQEGRIPLYRPKIEEALEADAPFAAVLEARRSTNRFGTPAPSARELGDLLYRALRIRGLITSEGGDPVWANLQDRPYPAGGAMHELEFYVTIEDCDGLEPGVYAYDPLHHELAPVSFEPRARYELLDQARLSTELDRRPPVLITLTARFGRIFWKYSAVGYSLILKDAGVALQTLQLTATALGLAACPIGSAEIEETPRLLGVDWRAESGVGSLVLGRAPQTEPGPGAGRTSHPANDPQWHEIGRGLLPGPSREN
jgi:SagB-type dehydrogenase family enzyme